jgi:hypothetical protein
VTGTSWTTAALERLAGIEIVDVSSTRADGSFSPWRTIWVVVVGDKVFVRSTDGPDKDWFRNARRRRTGRLRAAGQVHPVHFTDADDQLAAQITQAYRHKYRSSPTFNLNRAASSVSTLRLEPDDQNPGQRP